MKKLSIVTCTYNSEKYLQECIDSVIAQNLDIEDYEHIFVDAYSIDRTKDIIAQYMKKYSNVRLIERKPKGVYNAMNEGIKEAQGEYIMCLNSDDYLVNNSLNEYINYIKSTNNSDVYCAKMNVISKNGGIKVVPNRFIIFRKLLFKLGFNVYIYHPTVLIRRKLFIDMGCFDETKKIASDFGMWLKCQKEGKRIIFYDKIVTNFVEHGDNLSGNVKLSIEETNNFRIKYLGKLGKLTNTISNLYMKFYK